MAVDARPIPAGPREPNLNPEPRELNLNQAVARAVGAKKPSLPGRESIYKSTAFRPWVFMIDTLPLQLGIPGGPELLLIAFVAVLLFGANKLPALARSSGEAIGEFKRGRMELEEELKSGVEAGETSLDSSTSPPETEPDAVTESD
jgi:sec-independent protein translocase protein TatA